MGCSARLLSTLLPDVGSAAEVMSKLSTKSRGRLFSNFCPSEHHHRGQAIGVGVSYVPSFPFRLGQSSTSSSLEFRAPYSRQHGHDCDAIKKICGHCPNMFRLRLRRHSLAAQAERPDLEHLQRSRKSQYGGSIYWESKARTVHEVCDSSAGDSCCILNGCC